MQARLKDAERLADRASTSLDEAERFAEAFEPTKMEASLEEARKVLLEKDIDLYPEAQMHIDRYKELAAKVPAVKAEREKRDLVKRLDEARDAIVPRSHATTHAMGKIVPAAPTKESCDRLENAAKDLKSAIDSSQDVFAKDSDFAAWARGEKAKSDKALELVPKCRRGLAFLDGPVASSSKGLELQKVAVKEKDPAARARVLSEARTELSACAREGKAFDADKTTQAIAFVMTKGKPQTPAQVIAGCEKALKKADADLKKATDAAKKAAAPKKPPKKKK